MWLNGSGSQNECSITARQKPKVTNPEVVYINRNKSICFRLQYCCNISRQFSNRNLADTVLNKESFFSMTLSKHFKLMTGI